jgi:hypothetical protein
LELDYLDCSNGVAIFLELDVRINEFSVADIAAAPTHWLSVLLKQRPFKSNWGTDR